jgi:5-methylthioadenosine/S-adenosylhomocysteine deaminase
MMMNAGVGLQGIYVCNEDTILKSSEISKRYNTVLPMHVSETKLEVENARREYGKGVVEFLGELGVLNERFMAVHSVHVSGKEISLLAKTGANVSHNPVSNMKLGNGAAPISEMLNRGVSVTLGTDSVASNNNLDMFSTMKFASLLQKNRNEDASVLSAQKILDFATVEAARALGMGSQIGSIEEGKLADLILIDPFPNALPLSRGNIVSNMVYAVTGLNVEATVVNGVPLMLEKTMQL